MIKKKLLLLTDQTVLAQTFERYLSNTFIIKNQKDMDNIKKPEQSYDRVLVASKKIYDQMWQNQLITSFLPAALVYLVDTSTSVSLFPSYITLIPKPVHLKELEKKLLSPLLQPIPLAQLFFFVDKRFLLETETNQQISLTEKENAVLDYLLKYKNKKVSKDQLLKAVWQYHPEITTHTLETHIYRLRKKLNSVHHQHILLFDANGYRLAI